ncbi:MAG: hypothetical protein ACE367_08015 [Acidimicrobiales bacterium]
MTLDADHPDGAAPEPPDASDPGRRDASTPPDAPTPSGPPSRRRGGGGAGLLGAAMLAVGEVLEPEKTRVEIVQTDDEPLDDLPFGIDFGDLPPLD